MEELTKNNDISTLAEYTELSSTQQLIIDKIIEEKPCEYNQNLEFEFKKNLIDSVKQYSIVPTIEDEKLLGLGNYDESLQLKFLSCNKDILKSYYSGYLYSEMISS